MARTLTEIKALIKAKARTFTSLDSLKFEGDSGFLIGGIFGSLVDTFATSQLAFEQAADAIADDLRNLAATAPAGNAAWVRARILEFQNGDVITIDPVTFIPSYAVLDLTKRIITRASVSQTATGGINIKVAKNDPPEPISAGEMTALRAYYFGSGTAQGIGFAGVKAVIQSSSPDRIYIEGVIRYLGQYNPATVKTNVIAAIEGFFETFTDENFDGTIHFQELEDAIQAVQGVSRFEFAATDPIRARTSVAPFASATSISPDGQYNAAAGYVIAEDTAGETLSDRITTLIES